jgi:hypothetical protein
MAVLQVQKRPVRPVASVTTAWRMLQTATVFELRAIPVALSSPGETAPTQQQDLGFHPPVWCDTTNEPRRRAPGNAGSNDHLSYWNRSSVLSAGIPIGHDERDDRVGDPLLLVRVTRPRPRTVSPVRWFSSTLGAMRPLLVCPRDSADTSPLLSSFWIQHPDAGIGGCGVTAVRQSGK